MANCRSNDPCRTYNYDCDPDPVQYEQGSCLLAASCSKTYTWEAETGCRCGQNRCKKGEICVDDECKVGGEKKPDPQPTNQPDNGGSGGGNTNTNGGSGSGGFPDCPTDKIWEAPAGSSFPDNQCMCNSESSSGNDIVINIVMCSPGTKCDAVSQDCVSPAGDGNSDGNSDGSGTADDGEDGQGMGGGAIAAVIISVVVVVGGVIGAATYFHLQKAKAKPKSAVGLECQATKPSGRPTVHSLNPARQSVIEVVKNDQANDPVATTSVDTENTPKV